METTRKSFSEMLAFGQEGEHKIAEMLISKGYTLLSLYQFEGTQHAPYFLNSSGMVVSPDLVCAKKGRVFFVEVKTKTRWSQNASREIETGIDFRLYNHYLRLYNETNVDLWLVFNHEASEPTGVYAVHINTLYNRYWDGKHFKTGAYITTPKVFWLYSSLLEIKA